MVFQQQFSTPGDHVVEVSIDDDPLAADNRRWWVVPVRESLSVLLVDGHVRSEPYQSETDYLAQCVSPSEESPGQPRPIRVEFVSESKFAGSDLARYDVVVLCNVQEFSQSEVSALEAFLKQGKGVVFFGGDQVDPDRYNRVLYADGTGLLPVEIGPTQGDAAKKEAGFLFDPLGYRHAIISEFRGEADTVTAGLTRAISMKYHRLTPKKGSNAEVALEFDNGDAAIVEAKRHRGTVFVVATSANLSWTTWPLHKSYPPVMQSIVLRAAAGRLSERNIQVGKPFDRSFSAEGAGATVTVTPPKGQQVPSKLRLASGGDVSEFHLPHVDFAGPYQVRIGPPLTEDSSFAANTDPLESNLAKLDRADILPGLGWNFLYLTNSSDLTKDARSVGHRGELHRPLLYGLLILLLVESVLAWRFGHHDSST